MNLPEQEKSPRRERNVFAVMVFFVCNEIVVLLFCRTKGKLCIMKAFQIDNVCFVTIDAWNPFLVGSQCSSVLRLIIASGCAISLLKLRERSSYKYVVFVTVHDQNRIARSDLWDCYSFSYGT